MTIKPIQTCYRGYRFRSRLEARWAVFFETLRIPWDYERQGFDLAVVPASVYTEPLAAFDLLDVWEVVESSAKCYLPDFYLPDQRFWLEVKPDEPDDYDKAKFVVFDAVTDDRAAMLIGPIPDPGRVDSYGPEWNGEWWSRLALVDDNGHAFCECPDCGAIGIQFEARTDRLPCKECYQCAHYREHSEIIAHLGGIEPSKGHCQGKCRRHGGNLDRGHNGGSLRLVSAYAAARSARFEYGEMP